MFVVPSPKKHTATWPDPRYCADHAAPLAMVRCAPMMAYEPIIPCSTLVRCIDPPLPPISPLARPSSSASTGVIGTPAGQGVARGRGRWRRCSRPAACAAPKPAAMASMPSDRWLVPLTSCCMNRS